jgi:paired amphipathic helix protein Sin3a
MAQHQVQPHPSIENERDARELEEMARREAERDREMRERQHREQQPPHENHTGSIQIHQPVAVPPNVRSIHGPNGLLGNPGPPSSNSAQGPLNTAQGLFSGGPLHQGDPNARMQQQTQQPQAPMLAPFANQAAQQQGGGMNQAQQPILNVSIEFLIHAMYEY